MSTLQLHFRGKTAVPGATKRVSDIEQAFHDDAGTVDWWDPTPGRGQQISTRGYWAGRKAGIQMLPPAGAPLALYLPTGGPDSVPIIKGRSTGAGVELLVSESGKIAIPTDSDFCLWALAKAGGSQAPLLGAVGDDGGALSWTLRSSDLTEASTYGSDSAVAEIMQQSVSSSAYHLMQLAYNHAGTELSIWADGSLLTGDNPADGTLTYTHGFETNRISFMGPWDLTDFAHANYDRKPRNLEVALFGVSTALPGDAEYQAKLVALCDELCPSLGLIP